MTFIFDENGAIEVLDQNKKWVVLRFWKIETFRDTNFGHVAIRKGLVNPSKFIQEARNWACMLPFEPKI